MCQDIPPSHAGQAGRGGSSSVPGWDGRCEPVHVDVEGTPAPQAAARRAKEPFAALPHHIGGNPKVTPLGKVVLLALLFWARDKDTCWPSDASIGLRVGRSEATVQRALKALEGLGLIAREKSTINRTRRLIRLAWRSRKDEGPPTSPLREPAPSTVRDEGDVIVKAEAPREIGRASLPRQRQRPEPPRAEPPCPIPSEPSPASEPIPKLPVGVALTAEQQARLGELPPSARARVLTWLRSGDKICLGEAARMLAPVPKPRPAPTSTAELLARIREDPTYPAMAAQLLAAEFQDARSWSGYLRLCERAWRGETSTEALLDAYGQASGPKARNPGAVMNHVLRRLSKS